MFGEPSQKPTVLLLQLYIAGRPYFLLEKDVTCFFLICRLVSIIADSKSAAALDIPRRSLGRAVEDLGKLDYDNLPEAASR